MEIEWTIGIGRAQNSPYVVQARRERVWCVRCMLGMHDDRFRRSYAVSMRFLAEVDRIDRDDARSDGDWIRDAAVVAIESVLSPAERAMAGLLVSGLDVAGNECHVVNVGAHRIARAGLDGVPTPVVVPHSAQPDVLDPFASVSTILACRDLRATEVASAMIALAPGESIVIAADTHLLARQLEAHVGVAEQMRQRAAETMAHLPWVTAFRVA